MPFCKCSPRTRLQVPFEPYCCRLVSELYRHENAPRPVLDSLYVLPRVMTGQPLLEIACKAHVVPGGSAFAPKHIHNSFGSDFHTIPNATYDPTQISPEMGETLRAVWMVATLVLQMALQPCNVIRLCKGSAWAFSPRT
jgi:hypothetical protein